MLITVMEILLVALIMAALFSIIHSLYSEQTLFCPDDGEVFIVVPIKGEQQSAEQRLRFASSIAGRYKTPSGIKVLAVDMGAGDDSIQICSFAARDNEFIHVCSKDELTEILDSH